MSDAKFKVFIGYDSREDIAYQVAANSILETAKRPHEVEIIPLKLKDLRKQGVYTRDEDKLGSTEFTFSRFLIPHLTDFKGWALFIDCDFVFLRDVEKLFKEADDKYAVMCVQHDYTPKEGIKMDGQTQHIYPRKNWSSCVLWNCGHPANRIVTKKLVNDPNTTGQYLHRFNWLSDDLIGKLPLEWNWLVGWYKEPQDGSPSALHYTEGGPWFKEYERCEYAVEWLLAEKKLNKKMYKNNKEHLRKGPLDDLPKEKENLLVSICNYMVDPTNFVYQDSLDSIKREMEKQMGNKVAAIDPEGGINYKDHGNAYDGLLQAFALGAGGHISNWDREKDTDNALIIRGLGGGSRKALNYCIETGRTFYAIDTGYFGNFKTKYIHRVTKNGLQYTGPILERDSDRSKRFGYKFKKFTPGRKILICPPSLKVMDLFKQPAPEEWVKMITQEIRKYTDRPIEVRLKPNRTERVTTKSMSTALADDVHCLVTYNSIAAVEAIMEGKPAIVLGNNAASAIAEKELRNIDNPKIPSKEETDAFFNHIAYCQFTVDELRNGYAWRTVNESSGIPRWNS